MKIENHIHFWILFPIVLMGFFFYDDVFAATLNKPSNQIGLVGHWTFDGGKMLQYVGDSSGYGHNGILESFTATTSVLGPLGQALSFDGSDDVVRVKSSSGGGHVLDFTNGPFTISTWFNCTGSSGSILAKRSSDTSIQYQLQLDSGYVSFVGGPVGGDIYGEAGRGSTAVSCGTWYHAVVVVDASNNPEIYLNGVHETWVDQAGTRPFTFPHENVDVSLGARYHTGPATYFNFNGKIDDVRMYNRALTQGEIKSLYNSSVFKVSTTRSGTGLSNGLLAHWTLDGKDISGDTMGDASGNGVSGTFHNGPTKVAGKLGQAINFAAAGDYADVGDSSTVDLPVAHTISTWIKPVSGTGDQVVVFKGLCGNEYASYMLGIGVGDSAGAAGAADKINYVVRTSSVSGGYTVAQTGSPEINTWTHVAATHDGTTLRLYINGVLDNTAAGDASAPYNGSTILQFASDSNCAGSRRYQYSGSMDDTRFYNRTLTATEIKQLYNMGGSKINDSQNSTGGTLKTGLIGLWSFDGKDMSGDTAYDRSGQGNNGTLTNGPTRVIGKLGQALDFDGIDDRVSLTGAGVTTNTITFSAWVKGVKTGNYTGILYSRNDPQSVGIGYMNASNNLGYTWNDNNISTYDWDSGLTIPSNAWAFVAVSIGPTKATAYVCTDGVCSSAENNITHITQTLSGTFNIGEDTHAGDRNFDGLIDDVRIYNRTLTASEIKQLYNLAR